MLLNLHKKSWMEGLTLQDYSEHCKLNETIVKEMLELAKNYNKVRKSTRTWDSCSQVSEVKWEAEMQLFCRIFKFNVFVKYIIIFSYFVFVPQAVEEEDKMTPEQLAIKNVGKQVISSFLFLSLYCWW